MATIEELLDMDIEKLEKMTDSELNAIFEPYLKVTRPAAQLPRAVKSTTISRKPTAASVTSEAARLLQMFANRGIK